MRLRPFPSLVLFVVSSFVACGGEAVTAPDEGTSASPLGNDGAHGLDHRKQPHTFTIRGIGDRCWDFGAGGRAVGPLGTAAHLARCTGAPAQAVVVQEVDAHHDVTLHVGGACLGIDPAETAGLPTGVVVGKRLLVQACGTTTTPPSPPSTQRFALDGDAVLMGDQADGADVTRQVVIEPLGDDTRVGTPLVVGTRDVNDAEYFRFVSKNPNDRPHSGFMKLAPKPNETDDAAFDAALALGWGTVIEVDRSLVLHKLEHGMSAGTTLRGDRKGREPGPEIAFVPPLPSVPPAPPVALEGTVLWVAADHVRITGLRLRGPSRGKSESLKVVHGVKVISEQGHVLADGNERYEVIDWRLTDVIFDHNDGSDWTGAAFSVQGWDEEEQDHSIGCGLFQTCIERIPAQQCISNLPLPRPVGVRAIGNFMHHNERLNIGYGLSVGNGGFMLAQGNVMYLNRHSIASDGVRSTGYIAHDNFVLSDSPGYGTFGGRHEHDFDKHGTFDKTVWEGGIAGDWVDFGWNTFLGADRNNIEERGTPCRDTFIHDNVFLGQPAKAIVTTNNSDKSKDHYSGNQFGVPNPTSDLAVADFDADGIDDVFVGTGATWWYSSGGVADWRILNRANEHASDLRFGDFDGDGRADVVTIYAGVVSVSWAGISPWQVLGTAPVSSVDDLAVGDFDGDHRADLFVANGSEWFVAPHADGGFQHYATSSYRTSQLRFGDFDADGKTDVFGVTGGQWQYVPGGTASWVPLRTALTSSVAGLVVADFDGDGYADIGRKSGSTWQYAARGWGGFVTLRSTSDALDGQPIGRFDGDKKADVLLWGERHFRISSGARNPLVTWSTQDMQ